MRPLSVDDVLRACPVPAARRIALRVTVEAERMLRQGHPWLYDQAIRRQSPPGRPGDLAVIYDRRDRFLAIGFYDPSSAIRVRVLQARKPACIDQRWYEGRLAVAVQRRASLEARQTTGYRLVHGENDRLPGLVIDRYERTLVLKLYTVAWVPHLRDLLAALATVSHATRVILRLSRTVQQYPQHLHGLADGMRLAGPAIRRPVIFQENGLRFALDPTSGQKTGFFLDQRDNRAKVRRLAAGKSVLDGFAYTGGFSVYAARGGAREVTSLDASRPALAAAQRNMGLNRHHPAVAQARHQILLGDVFEELKRFHQRRAQFDMVVLDPPTFAKSADEVRSALLAYERLTRAGVRVLRPGGVLVTSSCSSHVTDEAFFRTVHQTAVKAGRPLREIERTGHALDHPIGFQEGAYLKCLFATAH